MLRLSPRNQRSVMIEIHHKKQVYMEMMANNGVEDDIEEIGEEIDELEDAYSKTNSKLRAILKSVPDNSDIIPSLATDGKTVDRVRCKKKGDHHQFNMLKEDEYRSTLSEANSHLKSKKGVRVVNTVNVENISQEILLAIKKISNHLTVILMPLAQKLFDTRFNGITLQDKNTTIPELYKDMDEKMYILTSLNNQNNTSLMKLDKEFDKLYNLVKSGIEMYVMPTGGSMVGNIRTSMRYP